MEQDKERLEAEAQLKKKLIEEYYLRQEEEREKTIKTTFQYWDGSHKDEILTVKKGATIGEYIREALH